MLTSRRSPTLRQDRPFAKPTMSQPTATKNSMSDQFARTVLLSASVPNGFGVGAHYLGDLLQTEMGRKVHTFNPVTPNLTIDWPNERYRRPYPGALGTLASIRHYRNNRGYIATQIAQQVEDYCERNGINQIWAVLESPLLYRLVSLLSQNKHRQIVATLWDPPESVTREFGLDRRSRKSATNDFESALSRCSRLGVISEAMGDYYQKRYPDMQTTVMRLTPAAGSIASSAPPNQEFVIGFAGSLYASKEFKSLLAALDLSNWRVGDRPVRVRIMGAKISYQTKSPACIEYLGYRKSDEVAEIMAAADCGYVPYWFDPAYELAVRLCFPSKLITCLASRTPIFFHGPKHSAPSKFIDDFGAGFACHSTDPKEILQRLEDLASADRKELTRQAELAIASEFNNENFHRRFHFLITGKSNE